MKIRFQKILSDGRTVRFEKSRDEEETTLSLNLIVQRTKAREAAPAKK